MIIGSTMIRSSVNKTAPLLRYSAVFHSPENCFPFVQQKCVRQASTESDLETHRSQMMSRGLPKKKSIPGVKDIVLVASGKGGVGKSTTSVNLAVALTTLEPKLSVGLLDADVFGPSIPLMMNVNEEPLLTKDNKMLPLVNYGVKCMSMGFLVEEKSAVIWRGLMVMSALEKLLRHVDWGSLDCLVIDSPPGTGDTLLSLMQNIPISGVIMVSTPQKAAMQVTRRGATMLQKLSVPIIGLVQNMSTIHCPKCSHPISPFGSSTEEITSELGIPLLADIPLVGDIATCSDTGIPVVISDPESPQSNSYKHLAQKVYTYLKNRSRETDNQSSAQHV